ncbi:MAG: ribonuclease P [Candidatus Aenigmarchaeota archaeon]|nr:ribonuclease P [Candidatus Aenigmarchaeota archaeon]
MTPALGAGGSGFKSQRPHFNFLKTKSNLMRRSQKPEWQTKIAKERIEILFSLAEREFKEHPQRSRRYVELARKIGLRYNVRFPKEDKRKFCKNCNTLLKSSVTSKVRLDKNTRTINVICLNCNKVSRYPYK